MRYWLTKPDAPIEQGTVKRFDPRHWTVDFPRGAIASIVTGDEAGTLKLSARFLRHNDLVGLIWESEDRHAHVANRRETSRDYSGCVLRFRWQSTGVVPLDEINGPTLTIEGKDEAGADRAWYVRLWNYAQGAGTDATVTLDFNALDAGFMLPSEAQRVHPKAIERMFLSLVPPGYDAANDALIGSATDAELVLSDMSCDGSGSVLGIGDAMVPPHEFRIATGYDDQYHLVPERIVEAIHRLGYRGIINHYVGMSHYLSLGNDGLVEPAAGMCGPAVEWHRALAKAAAAWGFQVIWSVSFEILDMFCPEEWKQRAFDGSAALTGYDPPSVLVSPASGAAVDYLASIAVELVGIAAEAGLEPKVQVGEPWWWVTGDHRPCLYDEAARALLGGSPIAIDDVRGGKTPQEIALLDAAGAVLASATAAIAAAAKLADARTETHLLAYLPGPLDPEAPEMRRANLPTGWAWPAFDVLQLEDYEWVTAGRKALARSARSEAVARLGYAPGRTHYFSGFAATSADWPAIVDAARSARGTVDQIFIWALPQVVRDGLTLFGKEDAVIAFDDVDFPIAIGAKASVAPGFSTDIVTGVSGHEFRNSNWSQARLRFDAGPGVRGEAELGDLIAFFRARRGPAIAFRFRDPFDNSSSGMTGEPEAVDQVIGEGDGVRTDFPLVKRYGTGEERRITRPVSGSVRVAVDGIARATGWTLSPTGIVAFDSPPDEGAVIRAGFRFDVPVRFADDQLEINRETFLAGEAPSVPLVEVRE